MLLNWNERPCVWFPTGPCEGLDAVDGQRRIEFGRDTMRMTLIFLFTCGGVALCGCQESQAASPTAAIHVTQGHVSATAQPTAASTAVALASPRGGKYTVVARPVQMKVGSKATTKLRIEAVKGMKFNKDFPSKFIVIASRHAKCDKAKLTKRGGDIKMDGKAGVVTIPLSATAVGSGNLTIMANFSICNEEQCFILRGESLSLSVTVK